MKLALGGGGLYLFNDGMYSYSSTNFKIAKNVADYFDKYHLLSSKFIYYIKWRKTYNIIQDNNHLNINGYNKIMKNVKFMNKNN